MASPIIESKSILPAPANCTWVERTGTLQLRQIHVTSLALASTALAKQNVAKLRKGDTTNHLSRFTTLPGVGDEAWITRRADDTPLTRVVARRENVVIVVDVTGERRTTGETEVIDHGARLVMADLVAELDRRR